MTDKAQTLELLERGRVEYVAGRYEQAAALDAQAVAVARELGEPVLTALALRRVGTVLYRLGNASRSEQALREAVALLEPLEHDEARAQLAFCLNHLGNTVRSTGRIDMALEFFRRGLRMSTASSMARARCRLLASLGALLDHVGKTEAAIERYEAYVKLARELGDWRRAARGQNHLARHRIRQRRLEEAEELLTQVLQLPEEYADTELRVTATLRKGDLALVRGERDGAIRAFEEALALARQSGNPKRVADALSKIGRFHAGGGEWPAALKHFDECVQAAVQAEYPERRASALRDLGELWRELDAPVHSLNALSFSLECYGRIIARMSPEHQASYQKRIDEATAIVRQVEAILRNDDFSDEELKLVKARLLRFDADTESNEDLRHLHGSLRRLLKTERGQARDRAERDSLRRRNAELEARLADFAARLKAGEDADSLDEALPTSGLLADATEAQKATLLKRWRDAHMPGQFDQLAEQSKDDLVVAELLHGNLAVGLEAAAFLMARVVERELRVRVYVPFREHWQDALRRRAYRLSSDKRIWAQRELVSRLREDRDAPTLRCLEVALGLAVDHMGSLGRREDDRVIGDLAAFIGESNRGRLERVCRFMQGKFLSDRAPAPLYRLRNRVAHGESAQGQPELATDRRLLEAMRAQLTVDVPRFFDALLGLGLE